MTPGTNNTLRLYRLAKSGAVSEYAAAPYATVDCYLERASETREALLGPVEGFERWDAVCDPCGARAGDRAVDDDGIEYQVRSVRKTGGGMDCDESCQLGLLRKEDE